VVKGSFLVGLDGFEPSTSRLSVVPLSLVLIGFQQLTPRRSPHIPAKYCTFCTLYAPCQGDPGLRERPAGAQFDQHDGGCLWAPCPGSQPGSNGPIAHCGTDSSDGYSRVLNGGARAEIRGGYLTLTIVGVPRPLYDLVHAVSGGRDRRRPDAFEALPRSFEHPHVAPCRGRGLPVVPGV